MAYSVANLVEQLPHWQHPLSTRLQELSLLKLCRENPESADDLNVQDALEGASLDAYSEVLRCDAEIEDLEKRLTALRHTRSLFKSCSEACSAVSKGLKAPMRTIPDDVLITIFEMVCTDPLDIRLGERGRRPINPHLELASVCYRWRELMLSTSFLWANLTISCIKQPKLPRSAESQLSCLTELILRSKLCPLHIELELSLYEEDTPFRSSVLAFLEPHLAARCQSITFLGSAMPLNNYQMPWSALHTLCIHPDYQVRFWNDQHAFTAPLPVLRTLEWGVAPSRLKFKLGIEWHTLTRLLIRDWDAQELQQNLRQCIHLKELSLYGTKNSDGWRVSRIQPPISLSSLRHLEMRSAVITEPGSELLHMELLQTLHMPSLQSLTLTCLHDVRPFFQTLSYCPLTSLVLYLNTHDLPRVCSLLKSYPSLETLTLEAENPTHMAFDDTSLELWQSLETLFLEMTVKSEEPVFLPRLSKIRFDVRTTKHRDQPHSKSSCRALVNMAHSRHNPPHASGVCRLRSLSVFVSAWDENRETEAMLVTRLKKLEGMDVRLKAWNYRTYEA